MGIFLYRPLSLLVPYNTAMGIKSCTRLPTVPFPAWDFLGVVFRPVIYPSLDFLFSKGVGVNSHSLTFVLIFFFPLSPSSCCHRRVLSSDAIEADLAILSRTRKQINILEHNDAFLWCRIASPHFAAGHDRRPATERSRQFPEQQR